MRRLDIHIEAPPSQAPVPFERSDAQPSLERESITDLAVQWRNAYAIAEAQERRLTAVQLAAAKLHYLGAPEAYDGEFLFHAAQNADENWWRQAEAIDASLGLCGLEEAANGAWRVVERLAERLLNLRPKDVQEAAIKFGILMTIIRANNYEIDEPDSLNRFLDDLAHLAGAGDR
jgi:hypothetical protein